ncbi:MAG: hydrogenase 2 operon protein HybA [Myxococcota bacterium]
MTGLNRRQALTVLGQGACASAALTSAPARATPRLDDRDAVSMLYDATLCTGCQACVSACNEANDLPPDTEAADGMWHMSGDLTARTKNIIKLYQEEDDETYSFVKRQCMHCLEPACVTGCPFKALDKRADGAVVWESSRCIGCRYCEIACPFDVPKFEWENFNPRIVKCEFCVHRLDEGVGPACTSVCPTAAVIFGYRADLLEESRRRIQDNPGRYHENRVYGEYEGGGTQVLYLSALPFEKLGLPKLGSESVSHYGTKVHHILYRWLALPIILYLLSAGIIRKRWLDHETESREEGAKTGLPRQL